MNRWTLLLVVGIMILQIYIAVRLEKRVEIIPPEAEEVGESVLVEPGTLYRA